MKKAYKHLLLLLLMTVLLVIWSRNISVTNAEVEEVTVDHGLPVVYLRINEAEGTIYDLINSSDHSAYCYGTMRIDVPEGFHYSDFPDLSCESMSDTAMSIRGRGNSSWNEPKKPFKIKLGESKDVFGMGSNKHWALLANAFDESLLRNRITGWLADQMDFGFSPRGVPVDVVITGDQYGSVYLGSYYLCETVRVDENRLEIAELKKKDTAPDIITGGYLLQNSLQVRAGSPDRFYTSRGVDWATHTPSFDTEDNETQVADMEGEEAFVGAELEDGYENDHQQQYIQSYIQQFEDILYEEGTEYRKFMDVENSAKYWLINIIPKNQDAFGTGSTYIYKDRDPEGGISKLYWGPVWDFDFAWTRTVTTSGFSFGHTWMKPMFYDKEEGGFVQELHKQWPVMKAALEELIKDGGIIDGYYEETKLSAEADHEIWHKGISFDYLAEVEKLKNWIRDRIEWVEEYFYLLDDMVHKVTYFVDGELYGTDFLATEEYLDGTEEYPEKEGFTFIGWEDENGNIIDHQVFPSEDMILNARYLPDDEVTHGEDIAMTKYSDIIGYNSFFSTYKLRYQVVPEDAFDDKVTWTSSDEELAKVDMYGNVKYFGTGTVTFTGKLRFGKTRQFTLTITEDDVPSPKSITPDEKVINMAVGKQSAFSVTTDPSPANIYRLDYESEDTDIVTVGELGVLTAIGPGQTKVRAFTTIYDEDDKEVVIEAVVTVIVTEETPEPDPEPEPEPEPEPAPSPEPEPSQAVYSISSDSKGEWKRGSEGGITYIVKRSEKDETCFSHFTGVEIDGKTLKAEDDYIAAPGSTVIEIKTDLLNRLSIGEHSITVLYDDGEVNGVLKITEEKTDGDDELPTTGDDSRPLLWIVILAASLICLSILIFVSVREKKRKNDEDQA